MVSKSYNLTLFRYLRHPCIKGTAFRHDKMVLFNTFIILFFYYGNSQKKNSIFVSP